MEKNTVIAAIAETNISLVDLLAAFTQAQLNAVPFEGSWTAGEVADHIYKFQSGIPSMMRSNTAATSRPADEKEPQLKAVFLNMETKMASPDFVYPSAGPFDKQVLIDRQQSKTKEIVETMEALDPGEECLDYEIPGLGRFTRLEWGCFILYHTQRHLQQMENIYGIVKEK